jgi:hypothetical protein
MENRLGSFSTAVLLLVLPVLLLVLHPLFSAARGPFYLAVNYDPDYAYLFNGLNLISGAAPDHVDHPGIPLHLFAASAVKLANADSSSQTTIQKVIARPENYLEGLNWALLTCYAVIQLVSGILVWKKTGQLASALLLQATSFLIADDFVETVRFRPELMIMIVALAMAMVLYFQAWRDEREGVGTMALCGFLAATGFVTKVNFAPFVLLPLFCLRTWRNRAGYLIWLCVFAGLWSLLLAPHYERFRTLIWALATRQGLYGTGEVGLFGSHYPEFLARFVIARPLFFLLLALSFGAVTYTYGWRGNKATAQEKRMAALLSGLILTQFSEFLMAAKLAEGRYLVPPTAFCGLNCAVLVVVVRGWEFNLVTRERFRQICFAFGIIILCWCGIELRNLRTQLALQRDQHAAMAQALEKYSSNETVVHYYGCSSPYDALWFGNTYAGHRYNRAIENQFPNHPPAYHVEEWPGKTYWTSVAPPHEPLERRLERGETLLLAGQSWPWPKSRERELFRLVPTNTSLSIDSVRQRGDEAIYRVKAISNAKVQ